jgi:hypothetical protein
MTKVFQNYFSKSSILNLKRRFFSNKKIFSLFIFKADFFIEKIIEEFK